MQKRIEKRLTYLLGTIMAAVTLLFWYVPDIHRVSLAPDTSGVATYSVMDLLRSGDEVYKVDTTQTPEEHQLRLTLPRDVDGSAITYTQDAMTKSFELTIPGVDGSYFYDYPMVGSSDGIRELTFAHAGGKGILDITTTKIRILKLTVEDSYVYLDFEDPHDVFDSIVVVDAGHGGKDVGANRENIFEKDINLSISYKLWSYFAKSDYNIGVYYTRVDDSFISLEDRVALANDLKADLFLSIHNNSTASGRMSGINGAEVMYRVSDESGRSREFAETCLNELLEELGCNSKGVVAGDNIYIIRTSEVPVALAEIGFLTNKEELNDLSDENYQDRAAHALYKGVIKTLKNNGVDLEKKVHQAETAE
ncbi:MAG: N-acetylmuramoyl-L-alanine amidase [Lachnospiraceae bacterium]|nr:N-acetylmuramoyl-L-alanine amidase [Lachnospiraceae bacterium]